VSWVSGYGDNSILGNNNQGIIPCLTGHNIPNIHGKILCVGPSHLHNIHRNGSNGIGLGQVNRNRITSKHVTTDKLIIP
jgi:hypothetical protein